MPVRFRILLFLAVALIAAYAAIDLYPRWQARVAAEHPLEPSPSQSEAPEKTEVATEPSSGPGSAVALPALDESDDAIVQALASLSPDKHFDNLFNLRGAARRFVATIDGATEHSIPSAANLIKPVAGSFSVERNIQGYLLLSSKNYDRYSSFVELVDSMDVKKAVALYRKFYPLFQSAYREIGSEKHFNDRVISVIDDCLKAPVPNGPILLEELGHQYKFADPGLESLSAAQRALIRTGPENERKLKKKLREIRAQLTSP